jgi:hypothetical protein
MHTILSMPPQVWEFQSTFLMKPPTVEGYQEALAEIRRALMLQQSADSLDILYYQMFFLEHWATPKPAKGRPKGPRDYPDNETFVQLVINIKQQFVKKGLRPTQPRVAMFLMELQEEQADILSEESAKSRQRQRQSVVRRLQRLCKGVGWDKLI